MIHSTINLIAFALSVFAFGLAVFAKRGLLRENKELTEQLRIALLDNDALRDFYNKRNELCTSIDATKCRFETIATQYGFVVCKFIDKEYCIIKTFTDPDQDYNRLCAEELVKKLNEK